VLAVSSASKVELGWDPTVECYYHGSRVYYDITVHSRINNEVTERSYRTSQTLSDRSADALRGRGTRVFKARLLDAEGNETGNPVALKDVWLDNNRDREGDIMEEICNEVSSEDKIKLQQSLPEIDSRRFDGMHAKINGYLQRAIVEAKEVRICYLDD
jgi:Fungal protein kinase